MATYKYPIDVDKRTHLDISAWEYNLADLDERNNTGLNVRKNASGEKIETEVQLQNARKGERVSKIRSSRKNQKALFRSKLYIPGGFGDRLTSNWQTESIALVGSAKKVEDIFSAVGFASGFAQGALNTKVMNWMTKKRDSVFGTYVETAQASLGKRILPNEAKVFKGTEGRTLPLNILFAPQNEEEAVEMLQIINGFKRNILPNLENPAFKGLIQLYQYPPIWDIRIVPGSDQRSSIRTSTFWEYRDMALTSFDVSYSDDTLEYTHFYDGMPTSARLTLNFESLYPAFNSKEGELSTQKTETDSQGNPITEEEAQRRDRSARGVTSGFGDVGGA